MELKNKAVQANGLNGAISRSDQPNGAPRAKSLNGTQEWRATGARRANDAQDCALRRLSGA